jgi:hypothetical protein
MNCLISTPQSLHHIATHVQWRVACQYCNAAGEGYMVEEYKVGACSDNSCQPLSSLIHILVRDSGNHSLPVGSHTSHTKQTQTAPCSALYSTQQTRTRTACQVYAFQGYCSRAI